MISKNFNCLGEDTGPEKFVQDIAEAVNFNSSCTNILHSNLLFYNEITVSALTTHG